MHSYVRLHTRTCTARARAAARCSDAVHRAAYPFTSHLVLYTFPALALLDIYLGYGYAGMQSTAVITW
jgi:hypothetical protein